MNHIHGYPHSKEAEFYKLLLDYDESLEKDLADCRAIWYESGTQNLMVGDYGMSDKIISMVISKKFGFIKWLVENEKIMVIDKEIGTSEEDYICGTKYRLFKECYSDYEILLMLLSISDEPINFLISILK